jgi:hypothetical protein
MVQAIIYFVEADADRINSDPRGWGAPYASDYLDATHRFDDVNCVDAIDQTLKRGFLKRVGVIEVELENGVNPTEHDAEMVWERLQNIDSPHELNNRSMDTGDIVQIGDIAWMVENVGLSKVPDEYVTLLDNIPAIE